MNGKQRAPVVLITGARTGIGRACADLLTDSGYRVYGTSRHPPDEDLGFTMLEMDVDETSSVESGIRALLDDAGRIDIVVNNAGFGYGGAVEDTSIAEAKAIFETNVFGVLRVCRAALPMMRSQGDGLIVNISSIGGLMGLPFQGIYSASKFALEGMTEALRKEVKTFGIDVVLIEPGDIRTDFTDNRLHTGESMSREAYRAQYERTLEAIESDERSGAHPDQVARTLMRVVQDRHPKPRYIAGSVVERLAVWLKYALPDAWFERILMMNYRLD